MSYQDTLITARTNVANLIAQITANPQPNYSVDGESYSWSEYFATLTQRLADLEAAIMRADGPYEVRSYGS